MATIRDALRLMLDSNTPLTNANIAGRLAVTEQSIIEAARPLCDRSVLELWGSGCSRVWLSRVARTPETLAAHIARMHPPLAFDFDRRL